MSAIRASFSVDPTSDSLMAIRFERELQEAAETRQQQLEGLTSAEADEVTRAQREALNQVLLEISAARQRLAEGTFGSCTGCALSIPVERLEIRPWSATCVSCARR
ncbi:TraR/DksA C4-type zinc finger protein [Nocardioides agariphilus]|uniref:TraR/DksA C4-type zinc finger protein n=1 Tax=Nocardioides agariphilus TaxID=433664 RepID=A0A930VFV0_9ACTN|nr:TraR/DksA C4-type zinc finger protein [Nocardioides agariphilus]MBF4766734.1 TraR/DksA C4-type zinc finger protein [Nocardioides agariphilus]